MEATPTPIPGLMVISPRVFGDDRGFFFESYNRRAFREKTGADPLFVQDNHSRSLRGVLRGLHYQVENPQGKLVRVVHGEVFDVAVDLREDSPTFLKWHGMTLSAANKLQFWIPEGFAHGFLTLSESAEMLYKATDFYNPAAERSLRWDDPGLGIKWPLEGANRPLLSAKDENALSLEEALAEKPFPEKRGS